MKLFSKLIESNNLDINYNILAEIQLNISAKSKGEASYIADSILASVKNQKEYMIRSVDEISAMGVSESIDIDLNSIPQDLPPEDKILTAWNNTFGDRVTTSTERMEFYHQLRKSGFDGDIIFNTLKGKI